MNHRQNPLYWSFGVGTYIGVRLRISWFMPPMLAWFVYEFGFNLGAIVFGILFVSVLLHEIGHILVARALDGAGDEILLWPLGGLAFVEHTSAPRTQFLVALGGPIVNLLLCVLFLPAVLTSPYVTQALHPLIFPMAPVDFGAVSLISDVQVLTFWLNWISLLVNLLPVFPLDGGQMFRSWLNARMGMQMGTEIAIRVAYVVAFLLAALAFVVFKNPVLLGLPFLIVVLAMQESFQLQSNEGYDDSFMGYDFSQGYTSLEKTERKGQPQRPGLVQRWLERRRAEKHRRQEIAELQTEQQLDAILAKVHQQGMNSLSPSEKRLLKRASHRYRGKGTEP